MSAPAMAPPQNLIDGVDVDAVAQATRDCPGVEDLQGGFPGEVATYLPGRRVLGVRVGSRAVEVRVRATWGMPVQQIAVGIQAAVTPLAGGRAVDVTIADLEDPPGTGQTSGAGATSGQAGATAHDTAAERAEAAGRMKVARDPAAGGQAVAKHAEPTSAGGAQGDPLLADALRDRSARTMDQPERVDLPAQQDQPAMADHPMRKGSDR